MKTVTIGFGIGRDKNGKKLGDVEHIVTNALRQACALFGGAFLVRGDGAWIDDSGTLISEPGYVLTIRNVPDSELSWAKFFAECIRDELRQQCVVFAYHDEHFELV